MKSWPIEASYRLGTVIPIGQHEAGHYIVARALGFRTEGLEIEMLDRSGSHRAGSGFDPVRAIRDLRDARQYLQDRVQVLYAGALAQFLSNGKVDEDAASEFFNTDGRQDKAIATTLINILRNIRYPDTTDKAEVESQVREISDDLWGRTRDLVERDSELISGLGRRIASDVKSTRQPVKLSEDYLKTLPAMQKRFPRPEGTKNH